MKSLRKQFVFKVVLAFLSILLLMFGIFVTLMHAFFVNTVTVLDQMECELVAEDVNMRLAEYRNVTEGMAKNANLVDMLQNCPTPEDFNNDHNFPLIVESMESVRKENTDLWIFSINNKYQIQGTIGHAESMQISPKDRVLLDSLRENLTDTILVEYTQPGKATLFNVVTPIRRNGELIGLAGSSIDMESLLELLQEMASFNNMSSICTLLVPILDEDMQLMRYTEVSLSDESGLVINKQEVEYPQRFTNGVQKMIGLNREERGEKYLSPIGKTGWYLTLFVNKATINNAFFGGYLTIGVWIFFGFLLVALALVALLAFRLMRPIHELGALLEEIKDMARKIALGEIFTRFVDKENSQDEIKTSLNQMLDSISYIFDNLPLGVAILDEDYRLVYLNKAIRNLLEIDADKIEHNLYLNQLQQLSEEQRKVIIRGIDDCKVGEKYVNGKLSILNRRIEITTVRLDTPCGNNKKQAFLQVFLNQTAVMEKVQEQEQIFAYFEHLSLVKKEALNWLSKGNFNQAIVEIGKRPSAPYLQEIYDNQLEMKGAFRSTVDNIEAIISQMQEATTAFASGDLHAIIDAKNAKGQYGNLVKTANNAFGVILSYFQSIPVPIRIIDKNYRVVFSNEASANNGFCDSGETYCYNWFNVEETCCSCPYDEKLTELSVRDITLKKKGKDTYWRVYKNPLTDEKGNIISMLEILVDETKIVELKKAADSANVAKSTFIASMSHEIRTPMNAILGYSQLLEMNQELSSENRNYVETIKRSGNHLLGLINDILELSKIEAGKIQMNKEPFDITNLLTDVKSMFLPQVESKGLRLTIIAEQVYPHLLGDMGKTRQIVINLVSNALKFTNQGEISIHAYTEEKEGGRIHLTIDVSDTGNGIAPEEQGKVFRAFEQTETGLKSGVGTGLGMTISRNFATLMDGNLIIFDSQVGKGSTFRLTLEMEKGIEQSHKVLASRNYGNIQGLIKPMTVLIVEIVKDSRDLLQKILEKLGFKVLCAENNILAIQLFREHLPDVVTMDFSNQGMAGIELVETIRREEKERHIPIIAITANAMQKDKEEVLKAGADLYLTKPLVVELLAMGIEKLAGAEYIFNEEDEKMSVKNTPNNEILPDDVKNKIYQAVLEGDFDAVVEIANVIANDYPCLSIKIIGLADDFDKEAICNLLDTM